MTEEIRMQENINSEETREIVQEEAPAADSMDMAQVSTLKAGDVVKGKVVKVEDNHALVDVGYKYDGIIPIRELSSIQLENAAEAVSVGDEVELKVLSIDEEKERLVLSKRAIDSVKAWEELKGKFERGEIIEAKVADVVKGGLVVDLGVRGFIPASMVERHFVEDFSGYKGRTLRLKIREIDPENNKLILSQKDVLEEEYEARKKEILANLEPNQVIEGTVQRLTPFGVFVDIGGIDGLVHISEMAWTHVEHPSDLVKEGDRITVKVLRVDPEKEKISLSMKAVQPGPWEQAAGKFKTGDIVEGTVKRLVSFGAFVEIHPGVEGLVHISQIAHRHIGTPHEVLKEGQQVKAKILDFNPSEKRVSLSIKEAEEAPEAPARQERSKAPDLPPAQGLNLTLGERFGDKLSKFKS
jgi:small subunit ribosomal protein S1